MIGGFTGEDFKWLAHVTVWLQVSDYTQLSNYTDWLQLAAVYAPITFDEMVIAMINEEVLFKISFSNLKFIYLC